MSDLISRQAAIDEANAWLLDCFKVQKQDRSCGLIRRLEDLPCVTETEDVAPVVHARWKFGKCTKCGGDAPFWCMASTYRASSYCPDCGAKMDEEQ